MLCCESIVSPLFFLSLFSSHDFFFLYTVPRKKEFQSNFQINLLVFFSPQVQIIKNHVRDHIRRIRVVVRTSLLNVSTNTAILEPHISLIFSSFFFFPPSFVSFFQQTKNWKTFIRARTNAIVRSNTL